jgi:hypothetical protein
LVYIQTRQNFYTGLHTNPDKIFTLRLFP